MAKRGRKKKVQNEFGEEIEVESEDEGFLDSDETVKETFAESKGTPANAHAKAVAKAEAKAKKKQVPSGVFYTLKGLHKVIKVIVKAQGAYEVYIGSLKRHKEGLAPMVANWKKQGAWVEPHAVKEKIGSVRASLPKK